MDLRCSLTTLNLFTFQNYLLNLLSPRHAFTLCLEDGLVVALLSTGSQTKVDHLPFPSTAQMWPGTMKHLLSRQCSMRASPPGAGRMSRASRHSGTPVGLRLCTCSTSLPIPPASSHSTPSPLHWLVASTPAVAGGDGLHSLTNIWRNILVITSFPSKSQRSLMAHPINARMCKPIR